MMTVASALQVLRTCWPGHETFDVIARRILDGTLTGETRTKSLQLAETGGIISPLQVLAWQHFDLQDIWADEYPRISSIAPTDLIVEDGNHRLAACAIRLARAQAIAIDRVEVFVTTLP
jgi:hypothetical protein